MESVAKDYNWNYFMAQSQCQKGYMHSEKQAWTKALEAFKSADQFYNSISSPRAAYKSVNLVKMADVYEQLGNQYLAIQSFHKAYLTIANELDPQSVRWVIQRYASYFKRNKMYDSALFYNEALIGIMDKHLQNRNLQINEFDELHHAKQVAIQNLELQNDVKLRELLILIVFVIAILVTGMASKLMRSRRQIKSKNTQLNDLLAGRERLISVLAHDVRAPLNNIRSLHSLKNTLHPTNLAALKIKFPIV